MSKAKLDFMILQGKRNSGCSQRCNAFSFAGDTEVARNSAKVTSFGFKAYFIFITKLVALITTRE